MKKILLLLSIFISGCSVNNFSDFYNSEPLDENEFYRNTGIVKVIETSNTLQKVDKYLKNGYIILGTSHFLGEWENRSNAVDTAKDKGASIVIIQSNFLGTEEKKYVIAVPVANTTYHSGRINTSSHSYGNIGNTYYSGNSWGHGSYSGTSTQWSTEYMYGSYIVAKFEQLAVFMAKSR